MRAAILTTTSLFVLGLATPSFAKMAKTPFDLFATEIADVGAKGQAYIVLPPLSSEQVTHYAKKLTESYGNARKSRGDLRIWEIPNPQAKSGEADRITVMLGPDKKGHDVLILDRRGIARSSEATRARAEQVQQALAQRQSPAAAQVQTRGRKAQSSRTQQSGITPMRQTAPPALSDID